VLSPPIKSIRCVVWLLSALTLVAFLDAVPDPPATSPHILDSRAAISFEASGDFRCQQADPIILTAAMPTQTRWMASQRPIELNYYADLIGFGGHASDPSPPPGKAGRRLLPS
jgi:hypothetical protein